MKKIKNLFSIFLVISMLTVLVGCVKFGGSESNDPIGNWYNKNGKCLEIRSDGTYKLEDDYGLGHWKLLNDSKEYEFTDFYGDLQKFEMGQDGAGQYIKFNSEYFYKESKSDSNEVVQSEKTDLVVSKAYDFSDGYAWVQFKKDGVEYYGIIDTDGKIIYEDTYNNQNAYRFYPMSGSICYMSCSGVYNIIDSNGKILMSSESGEIDEVLAVGDGRALVYKNNSGVNSSEHLYGVLDSNGNWIQQLSDWGAELSSSYSWYYAGDGMFVFNANSKIIYNSNDNSCMSISRASAKTYRDYSSSQYLQNNDVTFYFSNNTAFFAPSDNQFYPTQFCHLDKASLTDLNNADYSEITSYIALNSNGTYEEISEFENETCGKLLRDNGDYLEINDYANNTTSTISKYSSSMIQSLLFYGDYGLLLLKGADKEIYFTLIDKNGNEKFEPIKCSNFKYINYSGGKIVTNTGKDIYSIYDESGNVLAEGLNYDRINGFYDDIAVAVDAEDNSCYINSKGEKILMNLFE